METLYLVDGSGYIFRAFYAVQPLSTAAGLPTNALFGFTRMLVKLLRDVNARHIMVAFDTKEPTFRHVRYPEYKANRDECPADLVPQMPYFRSIVRALGIQCHEQAGVEADDIIATLAVRLKSPEHKVVIVSGDKDLCQLVDENVEVYDAMREIHYDPVGVFAKFGVHPNQIVDYLALIGDTSDNVPGVKGVGPKTAQLLMSHFGSIENLIKEAGKIESIPGLRGAAGVRSKIESAPEQIRLSLDLIKLRTDVSPFDNVKSVEEFHWQGADGALIGPLFDELEFRNLAKSLPYAEGKSTVTFAQPQTPKAAESGKSYTTVTQESLPSFVEELTQQPVFAFDTETDSLDVWSCNLVGLSFSWSDNRAFFLPVGSTAEPNRNLSLEQVRTLLAPIFADPSKKKVGLNLKFDMEVLLAHGFEVRGIAFDAMLASYVLNPDKRQHGLSALTQLHLHETMQEFKELVGDKDHIGEVALDEVSRYACHDADASWRLYGRLDQLLGEKVSENRPSPRRVFEQLEMPLLPILARIEQCGVRLDIPFLKTLETTFETELKTLEERIYAEAGTTFNLNSPKQLSEILFDKMGISTAGVKKTQSSYSTDASVLSRLAPKYKIAAYLLEYRELFKLNSTYIIALQKIVNEKTGRVHTSFNQAVASSGRLSSSDPNLQNIPIKGERGRQIRQAFIAEPGRMFVIADYSQIELRLLAHLSGDSTLQQAFLSGEDIHARTAKELFGEIALAGGLESSEFDRARRLAKTINFGIIYGMSAFRLAAQLGISRTQAQTYIDQYFGRYPRVKEYFSRVATESEGLGYIETLFGRRRYLRDIDTAGRDAGYAARSIANFPLQGSAADVMKMAMIKLDERLASYGSRARIVLQVHDELLVETEEKLAAEVMDMTVQVMEEAVQLSVPLKVDANVSRSWTDAE